MVVKEVWSEEQKREELLQAMSLNHDVRQNDQKFVGDPTEIALVHYAGERLC